jgi:hypothetical protein
VIGLIVTALSPNGRVTQMGKMATPQPRAMEPVAID